MMGGASFYADGQVCAILSSDGRRMTDWTLPEATLDDPDLTADCGRHALAAL